MKKTIIVLGLVFLTVLGFAQNYSLQFDGVDDYVDLGNIDIISTGINNECSVSFWLNMYNYNTPATGGQAVIFGDEVSQNNGILIQISPTEGYGVYTTGGGGVYSGYIPPLNQWVHFSQIQNNGGIDLYINGTFYQHLTSELNSETSSNTRLGLHIVGTRPFDGCMDQLTVWDKALTIQEIQSIMYTPPNSNETGLVGYWNFNEGSGTTAYDATANGNNGTINGAIYSTDVPETTNYSLQFDGVDDYVVIPDNPSISIEGDITMSAWILTNGFNGSDYYHTILNKRISGGYWGYGMSVSYAGGSDEFEKLSSGRRNPPNITDYKFSNSNVEINQWEHWTVTVQNDTLRFYKNGNFDSEHSFTIPSINQLCDLLIGSIELGVSTTDVVPENWSKVNV